MSQTDQQPVSGVQALLPFPRDMTPRMELLDDGTADSIQDGLELLGNEEWTFGIDDFTLFCECL